MHPPAERPTFELICPRPIKSCNFFSKVTFSAKVLPETAPNGLRTQKQMPEKRRNWHKKCTNENFFLKKLEEWVHPPCECHKIDQKSSRVLLR